MIKVPTLSANNLSLHYGDKPIFEDVNFDFHSGDIIGITGESGSGKSSLFNCLCSVIPRILPGNIGGDVLIEGEPTSSMELSKISTKVGIVFQNPETQIIFQTVEDEVAFGAENLCYPTLELEKRIVDCLKAVGMLEYRHANPNNLSGGQKQLIVIASILSMDPSILLFDEILAHVDSDGQARLLDVIKNLAQSGKTVAMIDHNHNNLKICNRSFVLKNKRLEELDV